MDLIETRKDYFTTIKLVNIHATMDLALANGAFGRLGEEVVVLVSPDDQSRIRQSSELWAEDLDAKLALEEALDTTATGLRRQVEDWKYGLLVYWIWFKCDQAIRKGSRFEGNLDGGWASDSRTDLG